MVDREWAKPASLLDLFLESFRTGERTKHLLNHLIVVALDNQALRYCRRAHPRCYLHTSSGKKIGSVNPDGLVAGWNKKSLVKEILELGYNMIFTVSCLNAKLFFVNHVLKTRNMDLYSRNHGRKPFRCCLA